MKNKEELYKILNEKLDKATFLAKKITAHARKKSNGKS